MTRRTLIILIVAHTGLGTAYFWTRHFIPIELTSVNVRNFYALIILVGTFLSIILLIQVVTFKSNWSKVFFVLMAGLLVLHNIGCTMITLKTPMYIDIAVIQENSDANCKVIKQHRDFGVFGDDYRTVEVVDFLPGFRYIAEERKPHKAM